MKRTNKKVLVMSAVLAAAFLASRASPARAEEAKEPAGEQAMAPEVKGTAVEIPDPRYQLNVWAKKILEVGPAMTDGSGARPRCDFYLTALADMGRFAAAKGLADVSDAVSATLAREESQGFEEGKNTLIAGLIAVMALTEPQPSRRELERRIRAKVTAPGELRKEAEESFASVQENLRRLRRL